jgi:hypothetical protein
LAVQEFAVAVIARSGLIKICHQNTNWSVQRRPPEQQHEKVIYMNEKNKIDEKTLQPITLDTDQLKELDRLIDSLKKEIVYPKRGYSEKTREAKSA